MAPLPMQFLAGEAHHPRNERRRVWISECYTHSSVYCHQKSRALRKSESQVIEETTWIPERLQVEAVSSQIAERRGNKQFLVPPSRLSEIETLGVVPSIYRFYSLAVAYHKDIRKLMSWFGVELDQISADISLSAPANSHLCDAVSNISAMRTPVLVDNSLDRQATAYFSEIGQNWGVVPITYLNHLVSGKYTYGFIGSEDLMMYPLIPPGTFLQIDESKSRIVKGPWKSEYERPIYLVETRAGNTCCWCTLNGGETDLQPHPLSPHPAKALKTSTGGGSSRASRRRRNETW